jgi:TonB family protein
MAETKPASPFRSAEFMIAVALLAVCGAVGAAWWFLSARDQPDRAATTTTPGAAAGADMRSDEQAALDNWNRKLQGDFAQMDRQHQQQEQRSEQERRKFEAEAEAARQSQRHVAELPPKPQIPPPPPPLQTASIARPEPPPPPPHQAVRTEAGVDWSSCNRPQYPRASLDRNEEGTVVLGFKIGADGTVQDGEVLSGSGSSWLDNAALQALRKCRFKPATLDGAAVAAATSVRFQWKLGR